MAKGLLKYFMLKLISERKHSGYELIKEIEEHSGSKPSTGTVYPLLKSMQSEGWIKGIDQDDKTYYEITKSGKEKLNEYDTIKKDYITKMLESVSIINETFHQEGHLMYIEQMELLHPLIDEIIQSQNDGIEQERIDKIILHAIEQFKQMRNEGD
jgi:DNA-binding PadR family transcriptional regulator